MRTHCLQCGRPIPFYSKDYKVQRRHDVASCRRGGRHGADELLPRGVGCANARWGEVDELRHLPDVREAYLGHEVGAPARSRYPNQNAVALLKINETTPEQLAQRADAGVKL